MPYKDLEELIEVRFNHLMSHLLYLNEISKGQVVDQDVVDYVQDIFNTDISASEFKKLLPLLKTNLKERTRFFARLRTIISTESQYSEQPVFTLNLVLQYEIEYSKKYSKILKHNRVEPQDKMMAAFHEKEFLVTLQKTLRPLSPNYNNLAKTVKLVFEDETETLFGGAESRSFRTNFISSFDVFFDDVKNQLKILEQTAEPGPCLSQDKYSSFMQSITPLIDEIQKQIKLADTKKKQSKEIDDRLKDIEHIENHVQAFFVIYPLCEEVIAKILNIINEINEAKDQFNQYTTYVKAAKKNLSKIRYSVERLQIEYSQVIEKGSSITRASLESLQKKITDLKPVLDEKITDFYCKNKIAIWISNHTDSMHEIEVEIAQLTALLFDELQKITEKNFLKDQAEQAKKQQQLLEKKMEYERFIAEKKEQLSQFRLQVTQNRTVQTVIARPVPIVQEATPSAAFVNVDMEKSLQELNFQNLALLRAILEEDKGIKYDDIVKLIQRLGGTISEIGNGSSHKRIKLQAYITEMTSHALIVGGIARPHGESHNSGELSRFNIKLVKSLFIKAKITLEIVEQLEKKLHEKEKNAANGNQFFTRSSINQGEISPQIPEAKM